MASAAMDRLLLLVEEVFASDDVLSMLREVQAIVLDVSGIFGPPGSPREWGVGLSPDESELWSVDARRRTLVRYELPE